MKNTYRFSILGYMYIIHNSIRRPKLFWVSAGAPLLSVILSTLLVFSFKAQNHASEVLFFMMGLLQIGKLQEGLNPPSWNILYFHGPHLGLVLKTGLVTGVILLTEGIAIGRTFAALKNYKVDGNKEMIAIVNNNAGSKTAVANIVMATAVMAALLFLMRLFEYTPEFILGAIIVTSSIGLIDLPAAYHIWKVDKFDFLVMLCAFFGVVFISVQEGLAIAITRPKTVLLGNVPGNDIYRDTQQYKEALRVPGFLILSIQAPINFANITYLSERMLRWIEDSQEAQVRQIKTHSNLAHFIVLDLSESRHELTKPGTLYLTVREAIRSLSVQSTTNNIV
ncbi:hypothetical protein V2J09_020578 [Rumex salicifolius]